MNKHTKRGYYTIEAAIFLPILIVGLVTLGYFIKVEGARGQTVHSCVDESRKAALEAYIDPVGVGLIGGIENRVLEDCSDISEVLLTDYRYMYQSQEVDGLISFQLSYKVPISLPFDFPNQVTGKQRMLFRGWIGKDLEGQPYTVEDMEREEEGNLVWLFPRSGKKYHAKSCTYVSSAKEEIILTSKAKKNYSGCNICHSEELGLGSLVYCFPSYGEKYHRLSCETVNKYIISMDRQLAEERGYTPCSKCGGGI